MEFAELAEKGQPRLELDNNLTRHRDPLVLSRLLFGDLNDWANDLVPGAMNV